MGSQIRTTMKDLHYISNNKGQITLIFSNFTILIFAIVIVSTILFILNIQQTYYGLSKYAKQTEAIANTIDLVSVNSNNVFIELKLKYKGDIRLSPKNLTFNKDSKEIAIPLMHANLSEDLKDVSCLQINRSNNNMVISKC